MPGQAKQKILLCVVVMALFAAACGSSGGGSGSGDLPIPTPTTQYNYDGIVAGTWTGTWTSVLGMGSGEITLTLQQNEVGDFIGVAFITNKQGFTRGAVAGIASYGNAPGEISFAIVWDSGDSTQFLGTISTTQIKGGYTDTLLDSGRLVVNK